MRDNLVAVSNNDKIRVVGINLETAAARGAPRHDQRSTKFVGVVQRILSIAID